MEILTDRNYNVHFYMRKQHFVRNNVSGEVLKEFFVLYKNALTHGQGMVFLNGLGIKVDRVEAIQYNEVKWS